MRTFKEFITEAKECWIAYDITDPVNINKYKTGFQGKKRFYSEKEAKKSFGKDNEDITVMKLSDFNKKFKTDYK